ncbi:hypothetical protein [Micromonospora sp. LOL_024]|uniref:hypothetical protein n=1 Tax=Micromonospora sp. LOL_024 TaxID=3345412 RepID=UPI003A841316
MPSAARQFPRLGRHRQRSSRQAARIASDITTPELIGLMVGTARALEQVDPDQESQRRILRVLRNGLKG